MARRKSRRLDKHYPSFFESLGSGLVNNLTLILAIAFLIGIGHTLDRVGEMMRDTGDVQAIEVVEERPEKSAAASQAETQSETGISDESWERIQHHERCTRRDYREKYYLACFPDGTEVYDKPNMDSGSGNTV